MLPVSYKDFEQFTVTYQDLMLEEDEGGFDKLLVCVNTRREEMAFNGLPILSDKQRATHATRTEDQKTLEALLHTEKLRIVSSYLKVNSSALMDLLFNRLLEHDLLDETAKRVKSRDCISFNFSRATGELGLQGVNDSVDLMTDSFVRVYIKSITNGIAYWGLDNNVERINRLPGELLSKFYYIRRDGLAVSIDQ